MIDSLDKAKKKQFIVLGVLGLVLGVVLISQLTGGGSPPAIQAGATGAPGATSMTNAGLPAAGARVGSVFQRADVDLEQLVQEIRVAQFNYWEEHEDRDPTLPLVGDSMLLRAQLARSGSAPATEDLLYSANRKTVTGIIWDPAMPMAVIDNEVVSEGYRFEDMILVKSIERDRVVLGLAGQDLEVVRELEEQ